MEYIETEYTGHCWTEKRNSIALIKNLIHVFDSKLNVTKEKIGEPENMSILNIYTDV